MWHILMSKFEIDHVDVTLGSIEFKYYYVPRDGEGSKVFVCVHTVEGSCVHNLLVYKIR
jgi:hypothetical protein